MQAHKFAVDIFNFEKRIAEITPGQDYLADPLKINNKMKVCFLLRMFLLLSELAAAVVREITEMAKLLNIYRSCIIRGQRYVS